MTRILVVDDEESYRDSLRYQLEREGFDVRTAADGSEALAVFQADGADVVLLDLMLPGLSGTEVCRRLRQVSSVPIIMVTAKDDEVDKIVGLELGADDYVTKPYSFRELVARVRAVLRRQSDAPATDRVDAGQGAVSEPDPDLLTVGAVRMDVARHEVTIDGQRVAFPLKEFEVLEYLLRNPGRVLTRGQLIERVWGADYVGDTKTLDVHIKRIRAKVERDPANPTIVLTVRGLGYKLADS